MLNDGSISRSKQRSFRISKELIEAIRTACPIEQVIGERVQLRRSGHQFLGRCPFHGDKVPSFSVHPGKGVYLCRGCGASGDVFTFVQKYSNCTFAEGVALLAQCAGIAVGDFTPSPELVEKVRAQVVVRESERDFERYCNSRAWLVANIQRRLGRAATHAENCLRAGECDPVVHDLAWHALKRYHDFCEQVERECLLDRSVLRTEWLQQRGGNVAA